MQEGFRKNTRSDSRKKKENGLTLHRNPSIFFNTIFGKLEISSPYLWCPGKDPSKPLTDEMKIYHHGRSIAVKRALSDFGIEDSFACAAARFKEHYHFDIGPSATARSTKDTALQSLDYIENKLSNFDSDQIEENAFIEKMLVELDGCEIRTAQFVPANNSTKTKVYSNPKKTKIIKWRDIRLGFVRPLDSKTKTFVGKMDSYQDVVTQMKNAAVFTGMTAETKTIGVTDGGIGLSEELKRQFPSMQFILDKSHLKSHFYETAEALGIEQKERSGWVEPRLRAVSDGNVEAVLKELEEENEKNPNNRLKRLIGYISRFYDALAYDQFKSMGYPIGSGEIESAHKSIPQKRLKIPGASWNVDSIDPMLALRILRANDWWEDFWNQQTEQLMAA